MVLESWGAGALRESSVSQRAAGPCAPPGWLLGLSVLDQTRPTRPRSPRLILHLTSHPRARLWSGWPSPEEPCPKWPTWGPSGGRKLQHAKHVDCAHGGLGGAHTHPGPSPRPHGPRHPRPRDPHPLGRVVPVPVTQATRSPSPWPRGPCPHHPGRTVPVPITQTIQLTSGSHRGRRPVDRSQDLQQMRQRGILLRNQHDQTGGRKWVSTGIAPVRGRPPSFR